MKKGVKKELETSEKIWEYVAGEGEFENRGQEPLGLQKRAQKNLPKNVITRFNNHQGSQSPEEGSEKKVQTSEITAAPTQYLSF